MPLSTLILSTDAKKPFDNSKVKIPTLDDKSTQQNGG